LGFIAQHIENIF